MKHFVHIIKPSEHNDAREWFCNRSGDCIYILNNGEPKITKRRWAPFNFCDIHKTLSERFPNDQNCIFIWYDSQDEFILKHFQDFL